MGIPFFQWGGLCTTTGRTEEALKIGAKQRCATRQDDGFQGLKGGFAGCAFCTHTPWELHTFHPNDGGRLPTE